MGFWSRKRMARELGVSSQRVHQLQASGALVAPEQDADEVAGWPDAYAESFVGRRKGRTVSQSVFGLSPSPVPTELTDDMVLQLQSEDRFPMHVMRFDHPDAVVVFMQPLAMEVHSEFAGVTPNGSAPSAWSDPKAVQLAAKRVAERWLAGDVTRAAFVYVAEHHGGAEFWDLVVVDDPTDPEQRRIPPHWLEVDPREDLPRIQSSKVAASVLANRLGRPVPAFLPRHFTPSVLEHWQANGRQPITIVRDHSGDEEKVLAATMIRPLNTVREPTRTAMVAALLRWVRWDDSGTIRDEPAWAAAGLADYDEDPATLNPQLILQQSDFAARAGDLRDTAEVDPLDPDTFVHVANATQDLIFNVYGEYGSTPAPRVEKALTKALHALYEPMWTAALRADQYDAVANFPPVGLRPYEFREWIGRRATHPVTAAYEESLIRVPRADDAAFRALRAQLLATAAYSVSAEDLRSLEPELFRDAAGVHVGRIRVDEELHYRAAVPVLRDMADQTRRGHSFTTIVVEPGTHKGPVYLETPIGPALMPFGRSGEGDFTHGYNGHGPGNLRDAIVCFLEAAFGHQLPERTVELLRAAIHAADQNEPLVIPRSLLGAAASPLRAL